MIMTAEVHEFLSHSRPLKYYFYISAEGLGTAMEYLNDLKYIFHVPIDILYKCMLYFITCQPNGIISK